MSVSLLSCFRPRKSYFTNERERKKKGKKRERSEDNYFTFFLDKLISNDYALGFRMIKTITFCISRTITVHTSYINVMNDLKELSLVYLN